MPELRMNTDLVEDIAGRIGTQHMNIKDVLGNLRALNAELEGAWGGPAQNEFEATYGNWIQQLESFSETLANVQGYLRSVAENFRELDEAARIAAAGATQI